MVEHGKILYRENMSNQLCFEQKISIEEQLCPRQSIPHNVLLSLGSRFLLLQGTPWSI